MPTPKQPKRKKKTREGHHQDEEGLTIYGDLAIPVRVVDESTVYVGDSETPVPEEQIALGWVDAEAELGRGQEIDEYPLTPTHGNS